jgi:hypothetical protein
MTTATSSEWLILIRVELDSGLKVSRFGNVYADEPFDANQAWRYHRRKMTVEEIDHVTGVFAIQTDRMAKVNFA